MDAPGVLRHAITRGTERRVMSREASVGISYPLLGLSVAGQTWPQETCERDEEPENDHDGGLEVTVCLGIP